MAVELWPPTEIASEDPDNPPGEALEGDVEAQIASEVSAIKRPRTEPRFGLSNCTRGIWVPYYNLRFSQLPDEYSLRYYSNMCFIFGCSNRVAKVLFISCKPPVNPVELVMKHMKNVEDTGIARTR